MAQANWQDLGPAEEFERAELTEASVGRAKIAISFRDGKFGVISGTCNHAGGPLGKGRLDGDYVVCPWHNWKFHRCSGLGEPGFEEDRVPAYPVKVEAGEILTKGPYVAETFRVSVEESYVLVEVQPSRHCYLISLP